MALNSFDFNERLHELLAGKAMSEFDSRRVTMEEMQSFVFHSNFNLGQDKKFVASVMNAYEKRRTVVAE